eukprot:1160513-Pelagomonas_calceolata.AAC.27
MQSMLPMIGSPLRLEPERQTPSVLFDESKVVRLAFGSFYHSVPVLGLYHRLKPRVPMACAHSPTSACIAGQNAARLLTKVRDKRPESMCALTRKALPGRWPAGGPCTCTCAQS